MTNGSHEKWIVRTVGAIGLALLYFLFTRDRISIDDRLRELSIQGVQNQINLSVYRDHQDRLESDMKDVKDGQKILNDKIDRVLLEVKKQK